tara:strand:- start:2291 stop:3193 length:903 start_codon:yes stop_codon:yes gene_type:complete
MAINEPLLLILSIIFGIILSFSGYTFQETGSYIITLSIILMLYAIFLKVPVKTISTATKNLRFIYLSIAVNFIFIPLFTWYLIHLFVNDFTLLLGLMMYFVMPCTDWFLFFTNSARGNVPLGTVLIPINLTLQIILLPFYLLIFFGRDIHLDTILFIETIGLFLIVPLLLAIISRKIRIKYVNNIISKSQIIFFCIIVIVMFASNGNLFIDNIGRIPVIIIPVFLFFFFMYIFSKLLQYVFKFDIKEAILLNFTVSARNSPITLAIAIGAFPDLPMVAAVIAIAPLIEIPLLGLQTRMMR